MYDEDMNTRWITGTPDAIEWIKIEFLSKRLVNKLRMRVFQQDTLQMPERIILKANDTDSDWAGSDILLDTGVLTWSNYEWKEWEFENDTHYKYYRSDLYRNDVDWMEVTQVEMMQCGGTTTSSYSTTSSTSTTTSTSSSTSTTTTTSPP
jgi:hypothetical protein